MNYISYKNSLVKDIFHIIKKNNTHNRCYVEPFVGSCNMISKMQGNRMGGDYDLNLIKMWKSLQQGWLPPKYITDTDYVYIQNNVDKMSPQLISYISYIISYINQQFGGYRREVINRNVDKFNMETQSRRSYTILMNKLHLMGDVKFVEGEYNELDIPSDSIIYCDLLYRDIQVFDYDLFWNWCREMSINGHFVYVSMLYAPEDFKLIWTGSDKVSKLFIYK